MLGGQKINKKMFWVLFTPFVYNQLNRYLLPVGQLWAVRHREKGEYMEQNVSIEKQTVPTFVKKIEGMTYVVKLHFNEQAKESMEDKVKKMLRKDVLLAKTS